ncbi:hypothetical protein DsansV1_C09g0091151 [Dioscorea sansibarensis]
MDSNQKILKLSLKPDPRLRVQKVDHRARSPPRDPVRATLQRRHPGLAVETNRVGADCLRALPEVGLVPGHGAGHGVTHDVAIGGDACRVEIVFEEALLLEPHAGELERRHPGLSGTHRLLLLLLLFRDSRNGKRRWFWVWLKPGGENMVV